MSSSPTNKSAATADAACIKEDATSANAHSLSKPKEESPSVSQSNSSESTDLPINVKSQIKALGFSYLKISFIFTTIQKGKFPIEGFESLYHVLQIKGHSQTTLT